MFRAAVGDRPDVPNYLVIITDGKSNNPEDTWAQAVTARGMGINILAVGIGTNFNQEELEGMASSPVSQNVMTVPDVKALSDDTRRRLTRSLCSSECIWLSLSG